MMYKKIALIAIAAASLMGCRKDPDSVSNPGVYAGNAYPKSLDQLESVVAAGYGNLRVEGLYGFQLLSPAAWARLRINMTTLLI